MHSHGVIDPQDVLDSENRFGQDNSTEIVRSPQNSSDRSQKEVAMGIECAPLIRYLSAAILVLLASPFLVQAQQSDRSKIPDQYKWDLTPLYSSDQAWRTEKEKLTAEIPKIHQFQ